MEFSEQTNEKLLNHKSCLMEVEELFHKNDYALYKIILHTGRKHQIRAFFSFLKTPIVGDKKYGSKVKLLNKIYLFGYKLTFSNFSSPLSYLNNLNFEIENLKEKLIFMIKNNKIN